MSTRYRQFASRLLAVASITVGATSCSKGPEPTSTMSAAAADTVATAEHGAYLATIAGCHDCHTPGAFYGQPDFQRALSGSELGWMGPWGTSYARNLTPDQETGIGAWSEDDIIRALQTGKRPDGSDLRPPMPWPDFAHMNRRDVRSLAMYLKSIVPVSHKVPDALPPGPMPHGTAIILPPPPAWDAPKAPAKS
jgi:mono/diheme cytochrome c family protein